MISFLLLAATLAAGSVALVAIPLVRGRGDLQRAVWAALSAGVVIVLGSAAIYGTLSNWSWDKPAPEMTPQSMVARLAQRLEGNPEDLHGWLQLGRSYIVLQQFPLAKRAYQRADRLANGRNAEALTGLAEALALEDPAELDDRAGRLIEQALAVDPGYAKALYYGALAALRSSNLPLARQRFAKLLEGQPPANIKPILERQIAAIDAQLGGPTAPAAASATQAVVRVEVTLAPSLQADAQAAAPLFVVVRTPGERGPPLAVKRLVSRFPQRIELSPANSMLPGHTFGAGQLVEVVARIARSGNPTGAKGDPYGEARYKVGQDGVLNLVIDRLTP